MIGWDYGTLSGAIICNMFIYLMETCIVHSASLRGGLAGQLFWTPTYKEH